ncbi:MAG: peptidase U32 family protein [Methanosarcinaceae archaeon]|nr:peptidase U32 family protein [Methanosarcinaceae archaeon]
MNKNTDKSIKIPELIMGVKNPAALSVCKDHADSVYFSLDRFSLRARANDITLENLDVFVEQVHDYGLRANLAVNSVIYPDDIPSVKEVIEAASSAGVDAIIAWDPAVITRAVDSGLKVHISTQANVSNADTANFYKSIGASRVVLSRELTLEQIKDIRQDTDVELEVFVHGAMCQAISGRCYLSAYLLGKSGNCGECSQPCRWEWTLHADDGREVDLKGKYLLSARDLCMIEHVPQLIDAGVDAFKVEGRLRNPSYTATVSRCYREALDGCRNGSYTLERALELKEQMALEYNRGFSTGFYFGVPGPEGLTYEYNMNVSPVKRQAVGVVTNYFPKQNAAAIKLLEQGLAVGDNIVIEGYTTYLEQEVSSLIVDGETAEEAGRGQEIGLSVDGIVRENDRVYKVERV